MWVQILFVDSPRTSLQNEKFLKEQATARATQLEEQLEIMRKTNNEMDRVLRVSAQSIQLNSSFCYFTF
jgi:hypothetical protein